MKLRLQRLSPFGRSSQPDSAMAAARQGSSGGSGRGQTQQGAEAALTEAVAGMNGSAGGAAGPPPSSAPSPDEEEDVADGQCISSSDSEAEELEQTQAAGVLVDRGVAPHDAAAVAAAAGEVAQKAAQLEAASVVGGGGRGRGGMPDATTAAAAAGGATDAAAADDSAEAERVCSVDARPPPPGAAPPSQQQMQRREQQHLQQQLPSYLSMDLEAQQQPLQAARAAAAAADPTPGSSVFRRCCPWLLPRMPWHRGQQQRRVSQAIKRSQSFAETWVPNQPPPACMLSRLVPDACSTLEPASSQQHAHIALLFATPPSHAASLAL